MSETYNGHANWATWYVCAHIENVEDWYREAMRLARRDETGEELRSYVESLFLHPVDPFSHASVRSVQEYLQNHMTREEFETVSWEEVRASLLDE
jgi:hypothetical protein